MFYDEATAAESKQDFIHKMQVSLKELRETYFWLRFIKMAEIISDKETILIKSLKRKQRIIN